MTSVRRLATMAVAAVLLCTIPAQSAGASAPPGHGLGYSLTPSKTTPYTPCPPGGRMIECNIIIDPPAVKTPAGFKLPGGGPLLEGGGELGGYDPADLQAAYRTPATGGTGETVAVVEAYGYAAAESDLAKYREKYGLSACTTANGCFKKVNQKGEEKNYPAESGETEKDWSLESALDVDMVSAACPGCHITVVEATTQEAKDTAASAEEAAKLGATEISNSYGYPENNETLCPAKKGCAEYLSDYNHAGVPVTVSSGDSGYDDGVGAPSWPATSPNVIAVGGTALNKASNTRGWSETVWNASGSGCSLYETKPTWQIDAGCAKRTDNDVSAVASPSTPVSVYNTPVGAGWVNVGGTSASAPLVAAIEAHADSTTRSAGAEVFYQHPGVLFDITAGSNGSCTHAYECTGEVGYDGPTGWGTPNGVPRVTGWFTRSIPNLSTKVNAKNNVLAGSSCLGFGCFAVGHTTNAAGTEVPLAEFWNGKTWVLSEIPIPTGAKGAGLSSVSCNVGLIETCLAVGHYKNSSGTEVPLAEFWNGDAWFIQEPPSPAEAKGTSLLSVSCASYEMCGAVGRYITSGGVEQTLAETWKAGSWTIAASPNGSKSSVLTGVSCVNETSEGACMAVGHDVNASGVEVTLATRWFLTKKWELITTPNPTGAKGTGLTGVWCKANGVCAGVGRYINSGGTEVTLAEHFTFLTGEVTIQESPNPTGAKGSSLGNVFCSGNETAETCTAIGHYTNSGGTEVTLAEVYASSKWTAQEPPNPTGAKGSSLIGLRCFASVECGAVGRYINSSGAELTLAEEYASTKWTVQETPNPKIPTGSLPSVSCPASGTCIAVGDYLNDSGAEVPLAEAWNGKEWSFQEPPNPTGAKGSSLTGVSCASTTVCTAVGRFINSSGVEVTLSEEYASSKWTIKETPNQEEAKSILSSVSCKTAAGCIATGHFVLGSTEGALVEEHA